MPEIYGSPRAGTIADLMRQRGSVSARAVQQQGDAEAQRTMASGQAWGNAIQNIGQTVSGTLRDYAQQRENAPRMALAARQAEHLAAELSAMETAQAQKKIGELAQMVKASGYDPSAAEPVFNAIATLSPEYAEPLKRSLMDPAMLRQVTDTLISQTPGYKAPEGFTLGEGQSRFDASGQPIANVPKPEPVQQPFTLGPGSQRFNPDGTPIASVPATQTPVNLRPEDVLLDGKPAKAVFNPQTGRYSVNGEDVTARVKPIPPSNQSPTTRYQPRDVIGDDGQPTIANYDALTGQHIDSRTGQPIKNPKSVPSSAQQTEARKFDKAAPIIKSLEELSERINVNQGVYATMAGGAGKAQAKVNLDDDIAEYESIILAFSPMVARALGHTGVLTQQDVDSAKALFPKPTDSKTLRDRKVARLRSLIADIDAVTKSEGLPKKQDDDPNAFDEEWIDDGKGGFIKKPKGGG